MNTFSNISFAVTPPQPTHAQVNLVTGGWERNEFWGPQLAHGKSVFKENTFL